MTTELKRLINLTATLYEIVDVDIKEVKAELSKDEFLAFKAEYDLALSLLVRYGLADYEEEYLKGLSAEDKGDLIMRSLIDEVKSLCDLAIKKDYDPTVYQLNKINELVTYVNSLKDFFDYGGQ